MTRLLRARAPQSSLTFGLRAACDLKTYRVTKPSFHQCCALQQCCAFAKHKAMHTNETRAPKNGEREGPSYHGILTMGTSALLPDSSRIIYIIKIPPPRILYLTPEYCTRGSSLQIFQISSPPSLTGSVDVTHLSPPLAWLGHASVSKGEIVSLLCSNPHGMDRASYRRRLAPTMAGYSSGALMPRPQMRRPGSGREGTSRPFSICFVSYSWLVAIASAIIVPFAALLLTRSQLRNLRGTLRSRLASGLIRRGVTT